MTPSPSKPQARARAKTALLALTELDRANASTAICKLLAASEQYKRASSIFLYYPVAPEADPLPLARRALADNKQIAFPRIDWDNKTMSPAAVISLDTDNFETRRHNIPEPPPPHPGAPEPQIDLILVPALAYDRAGNRLGRGGGFYDRFLADHPSSPTIGVCFNCQLIQQVPTEPRDIPVHTVITESGPISQNPL